ncbi:MAG: hypothetical protein J5I90_05785 [Caldilineales bacterium]|nr:hypothetical protein [Caldilineales bacterium]
MDSAMIGKIMKAKQYTEERNERLQFNRFEVLFKGDHRDHVIAYDNGEWSCTCDFFRQRGVCSHTMTMERVLNGMMPDVAEVEAMAVV